MARHGALGAQLRQTARLALTPGQRQSLDLLRLTSGALATLLDEAAAANPWIARAPSGIHAGEDAGADAMASLPATGPSLHAHVAAFIDAALAAPAERAVARALAAALAPSGWLDGTVEAAAAEAGVPVGLAESVLRRLQRMDPPGLFARSLAECLALQAEEAGLLDPAMQAVLARLDLVAAGDLAGLARAAGLETAVVAARVAALRRFDPKPGARFAPPEPAAPPDVTVELSDEGITVALNDAALPRLTLRPGPEDDPRWRAARDLLAAVARRGVTILAVADHVIRHQADAVRHGPEALRPLTRADVAAALGLAESTVSRAVAGTVVAAPGGTRPLAAWFAAPLGRSGATVPGAQRALARLVAAEPAGAPHDDATLAGLLRGAGFPVARRTVAKYRAALGIPPAAARRRQP
jgi:RNA polymerase sigma-54 factor